MSLKNIQTLKLQSKLEEYFGFCKLASARHQYSKDKNALVLDLLVELI